MLGISKYDCEETGSWIEKHGWSFPILCDGREVIERYGILNESALERPDVAGIPHPATFIVDKEGKIRYKKVWVNYRERTAPATMIEELEKIR